LELLPLLLIALALLRRRTLSKAVKPAFATSVESSAVT
jgi:hypothetical protein